MKAQEYFLGGSLTAAAKADREDKPVTAALKPSTPAGQNRACWGPRRCATQNQARARVIQQPEPSDARQSFLRWLKFNFVGGIGIAVQLAALALFRSALHLDYLLATALAVEAAVIHNFFWHERFTWADRPAARPVQSLVRLAKFNLSNGGVSIVGNLLLMRLLVGELKLNYVVANLMSVAVCSLVNFLLSDRFVFGGKTGAAVAPTD
jgi:putative flippase GtrA